jgi:16S rRNA (guanine(966)-N(2))-methyltransferase RsmD
MRTQIRIVAGSLRGRKLTCTVNPTLRPTPQMVREALFSILGNAIPDRPFFDVFAGTGVVGLEALSRGAKSVVFVERDFRLVNEIEQHAAAFRVSDAVSVARADVYLWAMRWRPPAEPVNVFLSPPFADYERRTGDLAELLTTIREKVGPGSVIVLQAETGAPLDEIPGRPDADERRYGRNSLLIWVKDKPEPADDDGDVRVPHAQPRDSSHPRPGGPGVDSDAGFIPQERQGLTPQE